MFLSTEQFWNYDENWISLNFKSNTNDIILNNNIILNKFEDDYFILELMYLIGEDFQQYFYICDTRFGVENCLEKKIHNIYTKLNENFSKFKIDDNLFLKIPYLDYIYSITSKENYINIELSSLKLAYIILYKFDDEYFVLEFEGTNNQKFDGGSDWTYWLCDTKTGVENCIENYIKTIKKRKSC